VFISIVHYLISHLTDNLTTPQVRDIVTSTNQQYEAIINKLENSKKNESRNQLGSGEMKDDLKEYLKSLNDTNQSQKNVPQSDVGGPDFSSSTMPVQQPSGNENQSLLTYDSSDSVFGNYDGDAYSSY
jgi:hypothetical protein